MEIPQKIKDILAKKEAEKRLREEAELLAKERERAELQKIEDLRYLKIAELEESANLITQWLYEFWEDTEARQVFKSVKCITIFGAKFFHGRSVADSHAWATLEWRLDSGDLFYKERYHTAMGSNMLLSIDLGCARDRGYRVYPFVHELHPSYTLQFAEAIRSGRVWDFIARSIK